MKPKFFLIAILLTLPGAVVNANEKVIELPPSVFSNNRAVEISRVTLSDTATVLDIAAFIARLVDKNRIRQLSVGRRQEVYDSQRTGHRPRFAFLDARIGRSFF